MPTRVVLSPPPARPATSPEAPLLRAARTLRRQWSRQHADLWRRCLLRRVVASNGLRSRPPRETSWPRRPTRRSHAPRRPRRRASATAMLRSRLLQISLGERGTPAMHSVSSGLCKVLRVKTKATRPSFAQHSRCQSVGRWCHGSSVQVLVHVRTCEPWLWMRRRPSRSCPML